MKSVRGFNVAFVGTGYIAGRHAAALTAMKSAGHDITIVGHVDISMDSAQKAADTWGGKAYTSAEDLLAAEQVDAVWLCVPPFAHGELERTFLERGTALYIEKPIGTDLDLPQQLAAEIDAAGAIVNVGYYWRCLEVLPQLRQMLAETPPYAVHIAYHGPTAPAAWWRQQSKSGGQVVEQATHLVDTARMLLGEATVLSAHISRRARPDFPDMDVPPATQALLQFGGDIPASFSAACVLGSFADTAIEFLCEGRKITLSLKELSVENADGIALTPTGEDPLVLADKAFIQAVQSDNRNAVPCSYAEALRTQALCCAIRDCSQGGNDT